MIAAWKIAALLGLAPILVSTSDKGDGAALLCKLQQRNPARDGSPSASPTIGPEHRLAFAFSNRLLRDTKNKNGGFLFDLRTITVVDPDRLLADAKIDEAGMTEDRNLLFFNGRDTEGNELFVPLRKSDKKVNGWGVVLWRKQDGADEKRHVYLGQCDLAGLLDFQDGSTGSNQ